MREKTFQNSPKGRSEIPEKDGEYRLLDIRGNDFNNKGCNNGWTQTDNLKRRIKEEHYIHHGKFSYIKIRRGKKK